MRTLLLTAAALSAPHAAKVRATSDARTRNASASTVSRAGNSAAVRPEPVTTQT